MGICNTTDLYSNFLNSSFLDFTKTMFKISEDDIVITKDEEINDDLFDSYDIKVNPIIKETVTSEVNKLIKLILSKNNIKLLKLEIDVVNNVKIKKNQMELAKTKNLKLHPKFSGNTEVRLSNMNEPFVTGLKITIDFNIVEIKQDNDNTAYDYTSDYVDRCTPTKITIVPLF